MTLFIGGLISGIAAGMLYSLLGFAIVLLYKSTGVANFAAGVLATFSAFVVYRVFSHGVPLWLSIIVGLAVAGVIGGLVYLVAIRPLDEGAGHLNLTIRTFGIYLVLLAVMNASWAVGQPFNFPAVVSQHRAFTVSGATISWLTLGTILIACGLAAGFAVFFTLTKTGLGYLALAERPDVARLLGFRTRRMTLMAWVGTTMVALIVGLLVAPSALLSTDMMDPYLLLAVSAAAIGGLTSLTGVFAAGIGLGVASNVISLYMSPDIGAAVVFGILLLVLLVRPYGILGTAPIERL